MRRTANPPTQLPNCLVLNITPQPAHWPFRALLSCSVLIPLISLWLHWPSALLMRRIHSFDLKDRVGLGRGQEWEEEWDEIRAGMTKKVRFRNSLKDWRELFGIKGERKERKREQEWEMRSKLSEIQSSGWITEVIIALITIWAASLIRSQPTPDNSYCSSLLWWKYSKQGVCVCYEYNPLMAMRPFSKCTLLHI